LDVSITFNKASQPGDTLTAEAKEIHNGQSTGLYIINVINHNNEQVALFKGTCFRTQKALL
jgi:acyl-CoA thioesterase